MIDRNKNRFLTFPLVDGSNIIDLGTGYRSILERFPGELEEPNFWQVQDSMLELGAGQGAMIYALSSLSSPGCKFTSVDWSVPIHNQIKDILGSKLQENVGMTFGTFLGNTHQRFDLISIVSIGSFDLDIGSHQIKNALNDDGKVIELIIGESRHEVNKFMSQSFSLLKEVLPFRIWKC